MLAHGGERFGLLRGRATSNSERRAVSSLSEGADLLLEPRALGALRFRLLPGLLQLGGARPGERVGFEPAVIERPLERLDLLEPLRARRLGLLPARGLLLDLPPRAVRLRLRFRGRALKPGDFLARALGLRLRPGPAPRRARRPAAKPLALRRRLLLRACRLRDFLLKPRGLVERLLALGAFPVEFGLGLRLLGGPFLQLRLELRALRREFVPRLGRLRDFLPKLRGLFERLLPVGPLLVEFRFRPRLPAVRSCTSAWSCARCASILLRASVDFGISC